MNLTTVLKGAVQLAKRQPERVRNIVIQAAVLSGLLQVGAPEAQSELSRFQQEFGSPETLELLQELAREDESFATLLPHLTSQETPGEDIAVSAEPATEARRQMPYCPKSAAPAIGTLVPVNMVSATHDALDSLERRVGNVDSFVCDRLGYDSVEELWQCLAAEQIDAVALAIYNLENGSGFVIGDQTGNGKGRFVAAMMLYAKRIGRFPIFVTKQPKLYADMIRDLTAIGWHNFRPLATNSPLNIPLPDGRILKTTPGSHEFELGALMRRDEYPAGYDAIFTTYSQMQTVKSKEPFRRDFLRHFVPGSLLILDESHEAGGSLNNSWKSKHQAKNRAEFARELVDVAWGVIYSSATYAKDPTVTDLYRATDMHLAVENPEKLISLMQRGGIALQSVVATQLVEAGQYLRRERSFAGVDIDAEVVPIDDQVAENMATALRTILAFDDYKEAVKETIDKRLKAEAKAVKADQAVGRAGAESVSFTSLLHNVVSQYLLALKADAAIAKAVELLQRDQKVVLAVSNTMGSFLGNTADIMGLQPGDNLDLTFSDLLLRYLRRSRVLLLQDYLGITSHHYITNEELIETGGRAAVEAYDDAETLIRGLDFGNIPISPLDWIRYRLTQAGYRVSEITGREHCLDYVASGRGFYKRRSIKERGEAAAVKICNRFNRGDLDVLILNRSGSTGISLHSSRDFLDQRKRHLVICQPEPNVNDFMQTLGRVFRAGTATNPDGTPITPAYTFLLADTPAEKRPSAVLLKKLHNLNANTIAARSNGITIEGAEDFINALGDRAAEVVMLDNPALHEALGEPLDTPSFKDEPGALIRRVTGRIPILPLADQAKAYALLEDEYRVTVEQADAVGEGQQEAHLLNLRAIPISKKLLIPADPGSTSPFTDAIYEETFDTRQIHKVARQLDVINLVRSQLGMNRVNSIARHNFEQTKRQASKQSEQLIEEVKRRTQVYRNEQLSTRLRPAPVEAPQAIREEREAQIERFNELLYGQYQKVFKTIRQFPIGTTVRVTLPDGMIRYAVVTRVSSGNATQNPVALGNWRLHLIFAGGEAALPPINFRRVNPEDDEYGFRIVPAALTYGNEPIYSYFDQFRSDDRVQRTILTGNLLRAYEQFANCGQLINFTQDDGTIRPGILLREGVNTREILEKAPIKMTDPAIAAEFVLHHGGTLKTLDEILTIRRDSANTIAIETSKATQIGGRYFTSRPLLEAAQSEFFSVGDRMRMIAKHDRLRDVLGVLGTVGAYGDRDVARSLVENQ